MILTPSARNINGKEWEEETFKLLKTIFPNDLILWQITTPELLHARPDFAVINAGLIIECKASGLAPVQDKVLKEHKRRQERFASLGMTYVWWVDHERADLIDRTRSYLQNVFYKSEGEKEKFVEFLLRFK